MRTTKGSYVIRPIRLVGSLGRKGIDSFCDFFTIGASYRIPTSFAIFPPALGMLEESKEAWRRVASGDREAYDSRLMPPPPGFPGHKEWGAASAAHSKALKKLAKNRAKSERRNKFR